MARRGATNLNYGATPQQAVAVDERGEPVNDAARSDLGNAHLTITASTALADLVAADAANMNDVFSIIVTNTQAAATVVTIFDGATKRWVFAFTGAGTLGFSRPANSASKQAAVNTKWQAQCSIGVTSVEIEIDYLKRAS